MQEEIRLYLDCILSVCPELTADELLPFSQKLSTVHLNKRDAYIRAGQVQKQAGFLVKGLMRAYHTDDFGNEKNIYFIPENEYAFHYASFMDEMPSPLTFQCIEPSIVVTFPICHLQDAYRRIPKFEKYGRLIVEEKLKLQQQRMEGLLYHTAEQRYLHFTQQFPQLFNRISIAQLCSYLGVERQTLTRIRKKISGSR